MFHEWVVAQKGEGCLFLKHHSAFVKICPCENISCLYLINHVISSHCVGLVWPLKAVTSALLCHLFLYIYYMGFAQRHLCLKMVFLAKSSS